VSPRNVNRLKLLGIGVLALLPVIGSYLLYWSWEPEEHTNYGTLLEARSVPAAKLSLTGGEPFSFEQVHGRWVFVVIDAGACPRACEDKLWMVRQVRKTQGKEMQRLERVWLIDDGRLPDARLARDYAGTWMVTARGKPVLDAFGTEEARRNHIYLVDPLGNVMMSFPRDPDPQRMIRDIGRLLKYSSIG
jgi:hypothetical protein